MSNEPRVTVIVSNFNGATYLPKLLESLTAQRGVKAEIIVVDRNSTDDSLRILTAAAEVIVVHERPETGLAAGYAAGAERATTELLFFCNEDMWFDPDCLRLLAEGIDLERHIAAADPWQWTYDGATLIHAGTRFRRSRFESKTPYPWRSQEFLVPLAAGEEIPFGCAGAVMIHRSVYEAVGGWDRGFFLDHEDVDLFIRVWQAGWKCVAVPDAKVFHAVNASNLQTIHGGQTTVGRRRYVSGRSSVLILCVKHFSAWSIALPLLIWFASLAGYAVMLRGRSFRWTLESGWEMLRRLPAAWRYRRERIRKRLPTAEKFYRASQFQLDGPSQTSDPRRT